MTDVLNAPAHLLSGEPLGLEAEEYDEAAREIIDFALDDEFVNDVLEGIIQRTNKSALTITDIKLSSENKDILENKFPTVYKIVNLMLEQCATGTAMAINIYGPGETLEKHRDDQAGDVLIANITGRGRLINYHQDGRVLYRSIDLGVGDTARIYNPPKKESRILHSAENLSNQTRISLGLFTGGVRLDEPSSSDIKQYVAPLRRFMNLFK